MKLFIVGQWKGEGRNWEFQGVFSDESLAVAACIDEAYFVGPATLDQQTASATEVWPGAWYPHHPNGKESL